MKIGIIGGTFNPIHIGHLIIASDVTGIFSLEKVLFIPSGDPPHKKNQEIIDAAHRLDMVQLAIANDPRFEVSDIEIKRGGKSYTVDTIEEIINIYGEDSEIYFIAGTDSAGELPTWKEPQKILSLTHFVAITRPGFPLDKVSKRYRKKMISVQTILLGISSSNIRQRIREGKSIKYLVPPEVEEYIERNNLYP